MPDKRKIAREAVKAAKIQARAQEPSPFLKSKIPTWACAIIHALSLVNNLFDASQPLHLQPEQIASFFELSPSTMLTKSRQIRTLPGIHLQDPQWRISTESHP